MSRTNTMARFAEPDVDVIIHYCYACGDEIYEGEEYIEVFDEILCDDSECILNYVDANSDRKIAGME